MSTLFLRVVPVYLLLFGTLTSRCASKPPASKDRSPSRSGPKRKA
jgi:hypothetical protein